MFCPNCGRELFGDAQFCSGCGSARPPRVDVGSREANPMPPPRSAKRTRSPYQVRTFDWTGECPVCQLLHSAETTRCPNDGSPLVVAFKASRANPFAFPIHTAEIRCSKHCGFSSRVVSCNNNDSIIGESYIHFTMPLWRALLHNGLHLLLVVLLLMAAASVLLVVGVCVYLISLAKGPDAGADRLLWVVVLAFLAGLLWQGGFWGRYVDYVKACHLNWWPFRRTFDFEEAGKASEAQAEAESLKRSVRSERYVRLRRP